MVISGEIFIIKAVLLKWSVILHARWGLRHARHATYIRYTRRREGSGVLMSLPPPLSTRHIMQPAWWPPLTPSPGDNNRTASEKRLSRCPASLSLLSTGRAAGVVGSATGRSSASREGRSSSQWAPHCRSGWWLLTDTRPGLIMRRYHLRLILRAAWPTPGYEAIYLYQDDLHLAEKWSIFVFFYQDEEEYCHSPSTSLMDPQLSIHGSTPREETYLKKELESL